MSHFFNLLVHSANSVAWLIRNICHFISLVRFVYQIDSDTKDIRDKPMHPLCGALPMPYTPVRVTHGALVTHWNTYAPPRCRTSQYCRTFIPLSGSLWNDLADPVFDGLGLAGFKSRAYAL